MSSFIGMNSDSVSILFSSLSSGSGMKTSMNSNFNTSMISDYYSIKNGSYKKLLNAYYDKFGTDSTKSNRSATKTKATNSVSVDSNAQLSKIKSDSGKLQESAAALLEKNKSKSLFNETETTDKDGNKVKGYDMDKIYKGIKDFADNYNATLETAGKSNVTSIQRGASRMISATKANERMLEKIGITIDKDNHLSVDESKLKKADVTTIKSLFNTSGSYGYTISTRASEMNANAAFEASKTNTYTYKGSYSSSLSTGDLYDSIF